MIVCENGHFIALNFSKCFENRKCLKLLSKSIIRQNLGSMGAGDGDLGRSKTAIFMIFEPPLNPTQNPPWLQILSDDTFGQ